LSTRIKSWSLLIIINIKYSPSYLLDEATAAILTAVSEDIRGSLVARLGPIPRLAFVKDIHYDATSVLEQLMAKTGLPEEPDADVDGFVEALLSDLRLEADAGGLRRDAVVKVIEMGAARSRADHRGEPTREQTDAFARVGDGFLFIYI
jgi:hypothetical protein